MSIDLYAVRSRAAHIRWGSTPDRAAATAAARKAAEDRFQKQVREEFPDLDHKTVQKLADSRRRAHMADMGRRSAEAKKAKKATGHRKTA